MMKMLRISFRIIYATLIFHLMVQSCIDFFQIYHENKDFTKMDALKAEAFTFVIAVYFAHEFIQHLIRKHEGEKLTYTREIRRIKITSKNEEEDF